MMSSWLCAIAAVALPALAAACETDADCAGSLCLWDSAAGTGACASGATPQPAPAPAPESVAAFSWFEELSVEERATIALGMAAAALVLGLVSVLWLACSRCGGGPKGRSDDYEPAGTDDSAALSPEASDVERHMNGAASSSPAALSLSPSPVDSPARDDLEVSGRTPTPARFAEVSQQLRSALIAEEMWKRRAAAAEEGQPMGSPRATQLAEESLSDRLSQIPETGDSAAQLAEITMQLVTAELDAEKYRQRFEAAEARAESA